MSLPTKRHLLAVIISIALTIVLIAPSAAQPPRPLPNLESLRLEEPVTLTSAPTALSPSLIGVSGRQQVVIRLSENPTARVPEGAAQAAQLQRITQQQDRVLSRLRAIDPTLVEVARLRVALNAVIAEVNGTALPALARDAEVVRINPVVNYERTTQPPMETVPYIGATPDVQAAGNRGKDVRVAVLDSGIDYTHAAFGGPGTLEAYQAAYGTSPSDPRNTTLDDLFPTDRVKGGYDFVGEVWPNGPLAPDPDPIDCGAPGLSSGTCAGGHGTHVADIIGGEQGVAPEVDLFAVKVCSAVSSSCSGVAILQGLDWVADPNGDGMTDDRMHIVNMSLGASYGQNYDDDSAIAVDNLQPLGILVVASAGNSADRPYITGTPAGARTALSVAQTAVPSDASYPITVLSTTVYGVAQPWAPIPNTSVSGTLVYGASLGNALGCTAYPAGSLTGQILLVDRGTCAISIKGSNGAAAGAVAVIVANNVAGAVPPTFSFGGGTPTVPVLSITQVAGNALKALVGNATTIGFDTPATNAGSVVGTSSRGPTLGQMTYGNQIMYGQIIKPEIGAPGASLSAVAGSGTGVEPFGGTSGAAPMVAGAAALLYNAVDWSFAPWELKARLINTAETNIFNGPPVFVGPALAPITRIGGGEVRINRAIAAQASAWELSNGTATISFGLVEATRNPTTLRRTIVIRNYGNSPLTYTITPTFRFTNDAATGAITPSTSVTTITVPPRSRRTFTLTLRIDPTKLPTWVLNSGPNGGNGSALTAVEFDGYLVLDAPGTTNDLTMPWHVLPRASGNVRAPASVRATTSTPATARLTNNGANPVSVDPFTLIGENPFVSASPGAGMQMPPMDLKYVGVRAFDGTGFCPANSPVIQFAITTHQQITHSNYPVEIDLLFDTNRDGTPDYVGFTAELSLPSGAFAADGRNAFFVGPLSGPYSAFFFTGHATNSANTVVTMCGSQIGVNALGQQINVDAYTYDNYFTGFELSKIEGMSTVLGAPRFDIDVGSGVVPANGSLNTTIYRFNAPADVTDSGILLQYSFAPGGREASAIIVR